MNHRTNYPPIGLLLFFLSLFSGHTPDWNVASLYAQTAEAHGKTDYDRAKRLLCEGDFDGALNAFRKVLRHDFDNKELDREFKTLQNIIRLREEFAHEKNSLRWNILSERLRTYYRQQGIHSEHIDLSLRIYRRTGTTADTVRAVEAYVLAERYQEALDFVDSLEQAAADPVVRIEKACIFIAAGELEQARSIARSIQAETLRSPDDLLRLARLQAITLLNATSVKTLVRCFEQTPPTIIAHVKKEAKECPEFKPLLASSEFAAAMATRSKIAEDDPACAKKWIGVTIDERPWYIRNLSNRQPINFDEWKVR